MKLKTLISLTLLTGLNVWSQTVNITNITKAATVKNSDSVLGVTSSGTRLLTIDQVLGAGSNATLSGTVTAKSFSGDGAGLTNLNAATALSGAALEKLLPPNLNATVCNWYVDSKRGADTNSGTNASSPLLTVGALLAKTIVAGQTIGLARGSTWREQLTVPTSNITVVPYGVGAPMLFDCSEPITAGSWSKLGGATYTYQASVGIYADPSVTWVSTWEDNTRLLRATNLAECDLRPGYYFPSSDAGSGLTTITLSVHASDNSNPGSNGKIYEYSKRQFGFDSFAVTGTAVSDIWTRRNLHNDGSFRLGAGGSATNCVVLEGTKHNAYSRANTKHYNCYGTNLYYTISGSSVWIYNDNLTNGDKVLYRNCGAAMTTFVGGASVGGFAGHATQWGAEASYIDCWTTNCNTGFDIGSMTNGIALRCSVSTADYRGIATYTSNMLIDACSITMTTNANGRAVNADVPNVCALTVRNSTITGSSVVGGNVIRMIVAGSSVNIVNNVLVGDNILLALTDCTVYARSNNFAGASRYYYISGVWGVNSDFNTFSGVTTGNKFHLGSTDLTLIQYRAATGQDNGYAFPVGFAAGTNGQFSVGSNGSVTASSYYGSAVGLTNLATLAGFQPSKTKLIIEGDSLSASVNCYPYPLLAATGSNNWAFFTNSAIAGNNLGNLESRWFSNIAPLAPGPGTNCILSVWIGANDYTEELMPQGWAVYCNSLSNYWIRAQASNMTVVAFTLFPRLAYSGESVISISNLVQINNFIRTCGIPNYIVDTGAMFPNNRGPDFSDGTHIVPAAQKRLAEEWRTVLSTPAHDAIRYNPQIGTNYAFYDQTGTPIAKIGFNGTAIDANGGVAARGGLYLYTPSGVRYQVTLDANGNLTNSWSPESGSGTIALVRSTGSNIDANTNVLRLAITNSIHNCIVVAAHTRSGGYVTGVTDSLGNTYTRLSSVTNAFISTLYYATNCLAGSNLVSAALSDPVTFQSMGLAEFSGVRIASPVDVTTSATGLGGAAPFPINSGSMTTTANGDLILGVWQSPVGVGTLQSGFAALFGGGNPYIKMSYKIQTLAGPVFFSVTNNTSSEQYQIMAASLQHQ